MRVAPRVPAFVHGIGCAENGAAGVCRGSLNQHSTHSPHFPSPPPTALSPLSQHLVDVCNTYKGAHPVAPTELARRMDGALLAIGTLADVLKVCLWCWGQPAVPVPLPVCLPAVL